MRTGSHVNIIFPNFSEFHMIIRSINETNLKRCSLMAEAHCTLSDLTLNLSSTVSLEPVQIIISNIPTSMKADHVEYFLESSCGIQDDNYHLELQKDGTAVITFTANPSKAGI